MSENMEELKRQFIKMAQMHDQQLGSVLRVCCEIKPDVKNGVLFLSPDPAYASILTEHAATIDGVSRQVFGKTMVMAISVQGKQTRGKADEKKQEMTPAGAFHEERSTATHSPERDDAEAIRYLLDNMHFENAEERQRADAQLRKRIRMSMAAENGSRRKEGKRDIKTVRGLKIYKVPAILLESHDRRSLRRAMKKHLGNDKRVNLSKFIQLCGGFPWKCSFDVGEYTIHGKRIFLGANRAQTEKNVQEEKPRPAVSKVVTGRFTDKQVPGNASETAPAPTPPHTPVPAAKSPREVALEEEIGKLRDRIDYFERLFEDHIHDVRTGQPYRPVKLGLVSSDKPA